MSTTNTKNPTHRIYSVSKDGENTRWTELGVAWPHKDGKGFSLKYNACPVGECDIVLRKIEPKQDTTKSFRKPARRTAQSEAVSAGAGAQ